MRSGRSDQKEERAMPTNDVRRAQEFAAGAGALRQLSYLFEPGSEEPKVISGEELEEAARKYLELPPGERLVAIVEDQPNLHHALFCLAELLDREANRLMERATRESRAQP